MGATVSLAETTTTTLFICAFVSLFISELYRNHRIEAAATYSLNRAGAEKNHSQSRQVI